MKANELITDEEIRASFGFSNFGKGSDRTYLNKGVRQVYEGHETGHTMKCIMIELGLRDKAKTKLTILGVKYLKLIGYESK